MLNFTTGRQLLEITRDLDISIAEVMQRREEQISGRSRDDIRRQMARSLQIMDEGGRTARETVTRSLGGLIGGESKRFSDHIQEQSTLSGPFLEIALAAAMSVMEVNATMGLIVAAPTAGSAGIIPGVMAAAKEVLKLSDDARIDGLFTAGAIGWLATYNGSISGAEGGCQAETGTAAAMAAAALVEMRGGTPKQATAAAALCFSNMLGIVCDPVGGLVEAPCQMRNVMGCSVAVTSCDISLSGIPFIAPLDEMIEVVYRVGKQLPAELRETGMGGLATAPSACAKCTML